LLLFAWRGSEAEGVGLTEAALREVALRGEGQGVAVAQSAGAILYNGLGRSQEALAAARIASECRGELVFGNWGLAELVEAAVRCGDGAAATDALESLSQTTRPSDTDWALGVEARCRVLLSRGETAEHLYREAIERLGRSRVRIALARAYHLHKVFSKPKISSRNELGHALQQANGGAGCLKDAAAQGRSSPGRFHEDELATAEHPRDRARAIDLGVGVAGRVVDGLDLDAGNPHHAASWLRCSSTAIRCARARSTPCSSAIVPRRFRQPGGSCRGLMWT
jgi:hypothetical protein